MNILVDIGLFSKKLPPHQCKYLPQKVKLIAKRFYIVYINFSCLIFKHILLNGSGDIKHKQNFSRSYKNNVVKSTN